MVQILPQSPGWPEILGQALGSSLGAGLNAVAQRRLEDYTRRQNQERIQAGLAPIFGENAAAYSQLPNELLVPLIKSKLQEPAYQNEYNTLQALLGGGQQNQQNYNGQMNPQQQGQGYGMLDQLAGRLPQSGMLRPGSAVPIANFIEGQRQHQQNFGQKQRAFEVGTLQPKFNDLQNQYADLNNQLETYQQLADLNKTGQIKGGIFGFGKPSETQLFEGLLESLVPTGATEAQLESARRKLPTLKQDPKVRQQLIDYNIKRINKELARVQQQAQALNYGDNFAPRENASVMPNDEQVFNQILQTTQGSPLRKLEQAQSPINKIQVANQQTQEQQPTMNVGDLANSAAYLGSKALTGAGEGLTSLVGLPFNLANFLSLGHIPVPESIKAIQNLPEQTVESLFGKLQPGSEGEKWLGNFVEDLASFLTPGGVLGKVGKLSKLQNLEKVGKLLSISPRAAATVSAAGNLAKLATEKVGGTESEGNLAKAGAMILTPIIGSRLANRQVDKLAQEAASAIKPEDVVKSPQLLKANMEFYNDLTKGVQTSLKKEVANVVEPLFHQKAPAQVDLNNVFKARQSVTKAAENPEFVRSMKNSLPNFINELDHTLEQAAKTKPNFAQPFSEMKDLGDALKTTNVVADFAKKHLGTSRYRSPLTYAILGYGAKELTGLPYYKAIGAIGIPAVTLAEGQRLLKIAAKSPAFRKYYGDYIKAATLGNVKMAKSSADNLDKIIDFEEKRLE